MARKYQMDEIDYYNQQEDAETGRAIAQIAKAFFDRVEVKTMHDLGHVYYKYVDCGPSTSFELHDGQRLHYSGEIARTMTEPWNAIRSIGVSSIVEGSDAEIPLEWIDLASPKYLEAENGAELAIADFHKLVEDVNDEASQLWHEANDE